MAKRQNFKDQSIEELKVTARDLDQQIFKLRNELALQRKLEKPHLLKQRRKEKARALTVLTQKQTQSGAV